MLDGKETKLPYRDLAWMREYTEKYASDPTCYDVNQEQDGFFHNVKFLVDRFATEQSEDDHAACVNSRDCIVCHERILPAGGVCFRCHTEELGRNKQSEDAPRMYHGKSLFADDCGDTFPGAVGYWVTRDYARSLVGMTVQAQGDK